MSTRTLARVGGAVVLAIGLLVATAVPASASATGFVVEGSSTIDLPTGFGFDPDQHFEDHPTTHVCAPNSSGPPMVPVTFSSSGAGTVGAASLPWTEFTTSGGTTIKTRMVIVSGTVTLTATSTFLSLVVRFEYRSCDSLTTLCTTNPVTVPLGGTSAGQHPAASARVTVAGTSTTITTTIGCIAQIRAAIHNATAVASLDLHFV